MDRHAARRMTRTIANALYSLPPDDGPAELIERAHSMREMVAPEIEEALVSGTYDTSLPFPARCGSPNSRAGGSLPLNLLGHSSPGFLSVTRDVF